MKIGGRVAPMVALAAAPEEPSSSAGGLPIPGIPADEAAERIGTALVKDASDAFGAVGTDPANRIATAPPTATVANAANAIATLAEIRGAVTAADAGAAADAAATETRTAA